LKRKFFAKNLRAEAETLKIGIWIFGKKSSNFVQKVPQFFKIKVLRVGSLPRQGGVGNFFQYFPSVFEIKMQILLRNAEVRFAESENELKIHNQSFFFPP